MRIQASQRSPVKASGPEGTGEPETAAHILASLLALSLFSFVVSAFHDVFGHLILEGILSDSV